ncbi:MAG: hypothetical protein K8R77_15165 [Anaerolineaceae bacterium]|nr:hypothetical protein [Anaerolineaceae bacterium]
MSLKVHHLAVPQKKYLSGGRLAALCAAASLLFFLAVVVRRAWLSDDAYITFRTVDNFINGYGLTWNTDERVQAYTHALWMFALSGVVALTREMYFTPIFFSIAMSLTAAGLLAWRGSRSWWASALGIFTLAMSNAFVDYSTSGLENPLSHLLMVVFLVVYFKKQPTLRKLFWLSLIASLAAVNRSDLLLVYIPALVYSWWQVRGWRSFGVAALGQLPLIGWEVFSLVYYGFLFPNTAYAKLNTGIATGESFRQGWFYLFHSLQNDPLTLVVIASGAVLALISGKKQQWPLAVGILLYLVYILKIGGDFMGGRFLTTLLLLAVALALQVDFRIVKGQWLLAVFVVVLVLGLSVPLPTYKVLTLAIQQEPEHAPVDGHGVADERLAYYMFTGLLKAWKLDEMPDHYNRRWGLEARAEAEENGVMTVTQHINIGIFGLFAGPQVHVVDGYALSDPLLARLPALYNRNWRIGHFERMVPEGYLETLESGENQFEDTDLGLYYEDLRLVTRGALFSPERWAAIWRLNSGQDDHLIDTMAYRFHDREMVELHMLQETKLEGFPSEDGRNLQIYTGGVVVNLPETLHAVQLEISLDHDDMYEIVYLREGYELGSQYLGDSKRSMGLALYEVSIPSEVSAEGFDHVQVYPFGGDGKYYLGHLTFQPEE